MSTLSGSALSEQPMLAWRGGSSASFAQHHTYLGVHQQRHDERNVEGSHGRVDHKGWVCEAAGGAFTVC